MLKDLIRDGIDITGVRTNETLSEVLRNHNLMKLWNGFVPFFDEVSGHNPDYDSIKKGIESYLKQIHDIDPASFAFRYNLSRDLQTRNLENIERINILDFCRNIEKLTGLIEGISCEFSQALEYTNEMRADCSNY